MQPEKIIIGLNASGDACHADNRRPFGGFHFVHRGGRDKWLFEATSETPFEGAYMTDVFKVSETDSSKLKRFLAAHPEIVKQQTDLLKGEFSCLSDDTDRLQIIAIGEDAYNYLPKMYQKNARTIMHFSRWGIKKADFMRRFADAVNSFQ